MKIKYLKSILVRRNPCREQLDEVMRRPVWRKIVNKIWIQLYHDIIELIK
jgi:hypothetical protein